MMSDLTNGQLAEELEAFLVSHPEGDASKHPLFSRALTALRTDRKAVLEGSARVADEIARDFGNRWREMNAGLKNSYDGGRIAGWSDGAADVAKSIRALAEGE